MILHILKLHKRAKLLNTALYNLTYSFKLGISVCISVCIIKLFLHSLNC